MIWLKRLFIVCFAMCSQLGFAQEYNVKYDAYLDQVGEKLGGYLDSFESLGVKTSGSAALENTFQWLKSEYTTMGYSNFTTDSFTIAGQWNKNLIIEKKSQEPNAGYILILSHYDTRNGPGANDNGSGVATTMEIARIVQDLTPQHHLRIIHFAGEEQGLLGSQHYVDQTLNADDSIILVFNLDQLGGTEGQGADNYKIYCERDENPTPGANNAYSAAWTNRLKNIIELYTSVEGIIGEAYRSDYIPFEEKGHVITGLYQYSSAPFTHTMRDSIQRMDTAATREICKGTLAFVLDVLQCEETLGTKSVHAENIRLYPNPVEDQLTVHFTNELIRSYEIFDISGTAIRKDKLQENQVNLTDVPNGMYFLRIHSQGGHSSIHRIVVQH